MASWPRHGRRCERRSTAAELRAAQAVVLPLELGLSLAQTAKAIGRSVGATCTCAPATAR